MMNLRRTPHSIFPVYRYLRLLTAAAVLGGIWQSPTLALEQGKTQLQCLTYSETGSTIQNQVSLTYTNLINTVNPTPMAVFSNQIGSTIIREGVLDVASAGIKNSQGNLVFSLGIIADALKGELVKLGLSESEASQSSLAAVRAFATLPTDATSGQAIATVKKALSEAVPEKAAVISESTTLDSNLKLTLTGFAVPTLQALGFTSTEVKTATQAVTAVIAAVPTQDTLSETAQKATQAVIDAVPAKTTIFTQARDGLSKELETVRTSTKSSFQAGDVLYYEFTLSNTGTAPVKFPVPDANTIQQTGIIGPATVTGVKYEAIATNTSEADNQSNAPSSEVTILPNSQGKLTVEVKLSSIPKTVTAVTVGLGSGCSGTVAEESIALLPPINEPLTDPFGRVTGCAGEILSDYRGFTVGVYEPDPNDPTGEIRGTIPLTTTELPDDPGNSIPKGLEPNTQNSNPFYLTNSDQGRYNFLLDPARGQLDQGRTYILVINPPPNSIYSQRRIRMVIGERQGSIVNYTASSLDGRPISATDNRTAVNGTIEVNNAEQVGLNLAVLNLKTTICQAQEIQITKTGDRAAAEPGDTVIYRLAIRNLASADERNIVVTDTLPLGFKFLPESVRGELQGQEIAVTTSENERTITFTTTASIPSSKVLNIVYAAQLTPDAVRGSGQNTAIVNAQRTDNNYAVKDGPAIHRLRIRSGIVSDCGTIIGRVFVDKNFDGEQQPGEPGVPNAAIFMEDGNRIVTDANGLFSLANVLPGTHTGSLDLSSLPGYTIAPNLYFK
ncbi:MAG TPA: hypothetical protein V6C95_01690, partial [Coleofasciculaceae cyanobacterium]